MVIRYTLYHSHSTIHTLPCSSPVESTSTMFFSSRSQIDVVGVRVSLQVGRNSQLDEPNMCLVSKSDQKYRNA